MTGVSTLAQALRQIQNIKLQQTTLSTLSTQMSTGKKTQSFSGLETDVLTSLRARVDFQSLEIYDNNLKRADIRINLMLQTVNEFKAQTGNIANSLIDFSQQGSHQTGENVVYDDPSTPEVETTIFGNTSAEMDVNFGIVQDQARNLYSFLTDLLNAKEGDRYMLAGSDTFTKPFEDSGTLDAAISTLLSSWKNGTITTDDLISDIQDRSALNGNPNALTDTVIGYSAPLSSGNTGDIFVRASEDSEFKYTALANEEPLRNIIVGLAFLKNANLPPIVDVYEDGVYPGIPDVQGAPGATAEEMQQNFYTVFNAVAEMVSESMIEMDQIRFRLENVRAQMGETKKAQQQEKNLLLSTIANVEDVDTNEVAVRLTTIRTQLEASYRVTALAGQLTLVNFI